MYVNAIIVDANYYVWPLQACKQGEQFVAPGTCKSTCPIEPLSIPNPDSYPFDLSTLTSEMQNHYQCLTTALAEFGGYLNTADGSTHRPPSYQRHLKELWDKNKQIRRLSPDERQACTAVIGQVEAELKRHKLKYPPARFSRHQCLPAEAFDATPIMPSQNVLDPGIDFAAFGCGLDRFDIIKDPNHFQEPRPRRFQGDGLPCE